MSVYLFDKDLNLINIVTENIKENYQEMELNGLIKASCSFFYGQFINSASYFGQKDENNFYLYKIINIKKENGFITLNGVHIFFDDLKGYIVRDKKPRDKTLAQTITDILEDTGWTVGRCDVEGVGSSNFYHKSVLKCFNECIKKFNAEFFPRITFRDGKIYKKEVDLLTHLSSYYGNFFLYGDNLINIMQETTTDVYTAFIGMGKGVQTKNGGSSRKIKFDSVRWLKSDGKPIDKPLGVDFVEIKEATKLFGYPNGKPKVGVIEFSDIEDKELLLQKTYEYAKENARPKVQFKAKGLNKKVELGEVVGVSREDLDIKYKTRIFKIKKDFINKKVLDFEFGDKIVLTISDRLKETENKEEKRIEKIQSLLDKFLKDTTNYYFNEDGYNYELKVGNKYKLPAGLYSFDKPIDKEPTKVVYMGAGKILIADSKDSKGMWKFRTAITPEGIAGSEIFTNSITANKLASDVGQSLDLSSNVSITSTVKERVKDETKGLKGELKSLIDQNKNEINLTVEKALSGEDMVTYYDIIDRKKEPGKEKTSSEKLTRFYLTEKLQKFTEYTLKFDLETEDVGEFRLNTPHEPTKTYTNGHNEHTFHANCEDDYISFSGGFKTEIREKKEIYNKNKLMNIEEVGEIVNLGSSEDCSQLKINFSTFPKDALDRCILTFLNANGDNSTSDVFFVAFKDDKPLNDSKYIERITRQGFVHELDPRTIKMYKEYLNIDLTEFMDSMFTTNQLSLELCDLDLTKITGLYAFRDLPGETIESKVKKIRVEYYETETITTPASVPIDYTIKNVELIKKNIVKSKFVRRDEHNNDINRVTKDISKISVKADSIESKVRSVEEGVDEKFSSIKQKADSISLTVNEVNNRVSGVANEINLIKEEDRGRKSGSDLYFYTTEPIKADTDYKLIFDLKTVNDASSVRVYNCQKSYKIKRGTNNLIVRFGSERSNINIDSGGDKVIENVRLIKSDGIDTQNLVDKDNVISSINLDSSGVKIRGDKVEIQGDVDISGDVIIRKINNANSWTTISGDKIESGTIKGVTLEALRKIKIGSQGYMNPIDIGMQIKAPRYRDANYGMTFQFRGAESHDSGGTTPMGIFMGKDNDFSTGGTLYTSSDYMMWIGGRARIANYWRDSAYLGTVIVSNHGMNDPISLSGGAFSKITWILADFEDGDIWFHDGTDGDPQNIIVNGRKSSDKRLKENIKPTTYNALELIEKLKFYEFDWKLSKTGRRKKHTKCGIIADDLQSLNAELVDEKGDEKGENKIKYIDDYRLLNVAIKAIQELQQEVKELKEKLNEKH